MDREYFIVLGGRDMINKYDILEKVAELLGRFGQLLVWVGMIAGSLLIWYFVFALIFNG